MKVSALAMLPLAGLASADVPAWGQCGGESYTGSTTCISGWTCVYSDPWWSQCQPCEYHLLAYARYWDESDEMNQLRPLLLGPPLPQPPLARLVLRPPSSQPMDSVVDRDILARLTASPATLAVSLISGTANVSQVSSLCRSQVALVNSNGYA